MLCGPIDMKGQRSSWNAWPNGMPMWECARPTVNWWPGHLGTARSFVLSCDDWWELLLVQRLAKLNLNFYLLCVYFHSIDYKLVQWARCRWPMSIRDADMARSHCKQSQRKSLNWIMMCTAALMSIIMYHGGCLRKSASPLSMIHIGCERIPL